MMMAAVTRAWWGRGATPDPSGSETCVTAPSGSGFEVACMPIRLRFTALQLDNVRPAPPQVDPSISLALDAATLYAATAMVSGVAAFSC